MLFNVIFVETECILIFRKGRKFLQRLKSLVFFPRRIINILKPWLGAVQGLFLRLSRKLKGGRNEKNEHHA